uniref:DNA_pol3_finger domain-containing protein n=1 Tax=Brugia timori TaxID=42155 RepID=A0A0R3R4E9_9BILA
MPQPSRLKTSSGEVIRYLNSFNLEMGFDGRISVCIGSSEISSVYLRIMFEVSKRV